MLEQTFDTFKLSDNFNDVIERALDYYDNICSSFDYAPDLVCLEKTYAIEKEMRRDEFPVLLDLLDYSCENDYRTKDVLRILGRFLFVHFQKLHSFDAINRSSVERLMKASFKFLCFHKWGYDDTIFIRLAIYNLLDIYGIKDALAIAEHIPSESSKCNDLSLGIVQDSVVRFIHSTNTITPVKPDWLHAYIYKARFGYLYCKKFFSQNSRSSLPFTIATYSLAYKGLCCRTVQCSSKVVAFEIEERKRSSEYRPMEDSFLYNFATMKFE